MSSPRFRKTFAFDDVLGLPPTDLAPELEAADFRVVTPEWPVVDPSEYLAPLADNFSADELAAAQAALIEDGVFLSLEWTSAYLGREFPMPDGNALRFTPESLARVAVKFGWAVAYAAELAEGMAGDFEVNFSATPQATTPLEHLFIAMGLRSRGVAFAALRLCWPGRFEAAVDFEGDTAEFEFAVAAHAAVARLAGNYRLSFSHAEEKFTVLPVIARECGDLLHLKTSGLAWMAAMRTFSRVEPALFRKILGATQERFAFDKVGAVISTNEEEVRFLPEVPDSELEHTYCNEPHGRQFLYVSARSTAHDPALRAALATHARLHREIFAESIARHLTALRALPSPEAAT